MIDTEIATAERRRGCRLLAWGLLVASTVSGCALGPLEPRAIAPALATGSPVVHLMPMLDRRTIQRSRFILATKQVESAASSILGEKGYRIEIVEVPPAELVQLSADSRAMELSVEELVLAGPAVAERLLVVYIDLIDSEFNSPILDFRVKVSAVLIDTATRTAVWRNSGEGSANGAGVVAVVSPSAAQYEAIYRSLSNLFAPLTADDSRSS